MLSARILSITSFWGQGVPGQAYLETGGNRTRGGGIVMLMESMVEEETKTEFVVRAKVL